MPRARNIKPAFFTSDKLAEITPLGRLLFIGLWCVADRAGRLEDRPKKIKAEVLPYDNVDVDILLDALANGRFILRYRASDIEYIQVINFAKHQHPHMKESSSTIPAPPENLASTVPVPENAERTGLIPDSGSLIPDSVAPSSKESSEVVSASPPPCPHKMIVDLYHELLPQNPGVVALNDSREALMRSRWRQVWSERVKRGRPREHEDLLGWFKRFFEDVATSQFLTGRVPGSNGRPPFIADLEWLMGPKNFLQVIEGKYHRDA